MPGPADTRGAARSRAVSASVAIVAVLGVTAAVFFANLIASRDPVRLDMTFAGAHRLSPRTDALVAQLTGPYEIVLAIDPRTEDRRVLDAIRDVLDAYARSSGDVGFTELDLGATAGIEGASSLLARLAADRAPELTDRRALVDDAIAVLNDAAPAFERVGQGLERVRGAIPGDESAARTNRAYFEERAAVARVTAREARELASSVGAALDAGTLPGGIDDTNALLDPLREASTALGAQLRTLGADVRRFVDAGAAPRGARDLASSAVRDIEAFGDRAAVIADRLERARPIGVIDAARAVDSGQTLLIVGPPGTGVTAVDLEALFPAADMLERAGVSPGAVAADRTEHLVATAITAIARPNRPIVVLTHAQPSSGLAAMGQLAQLRQRLESRGMTIVEWAIATGEPEPDLTSIDPAGARPVVYFTLAPDSSTGTGGAGADPSSSGAARAEQLGKAIAGLLDDGKPVLASASPSVFPTYGDADPVVAPFERFGVRARTGTPLLSSTGGAGVITETRVVSGDSEHPIGASVRDLGALLPWAIPIEIEPIEGVRTDAVMRLNETAGVWAESSWLGYWRTPRDRRALLPTPPAFDEGADERRDSWDLAVAMERVNPPSGARGGRVSRAVVVGSNGWYLDPIAAQRVQAAGRAPLAFPGNVELFESSVLWLAGEDELIAPSSSAGEVALVRDLGAGREVIRWVLIAGVPGLILAGGIAHRVVRG